MQDGPGAAISEGIGRLLRVHTGDGPTKAMTTISTDLVVITLADSLSTAERELAAGGMGELVAPARDLLLRGLRPDAIAIVEEVTQREVAAYLTDQQHDPDLAVLIFYLRPSSERLGLDAEASFTDTGISSLGSRPVGSTLNS